MLLYKITDKKPGQYRMSDHAAELCWQINWTMMWPRAHLGMLTVARTAVNHLTQYRMFMCVCKFVCFKRDYRFLSSPSTVSFKLQRPALNLKIHILHKSLVSLLINLIHQSCHLWYQQFYTTKNVCWDCTYLSSKR